ncbi:nitrite reductase/ring-hydroxylating ferredoxin subunit [Pedobacter sp. UYEF25]
MRRYCGFLICVFLLFGCGKVQDFIPDVPVNFTAPLTDPRLSPLNTVGGAVIINGYGISGIIISKTPFGEFVAYDRTSTVNPQKKCAVVLESGEFTVTDPCSGAKFSLLDGSPAKAPAIRSLKQYYVSISGTVLHVTN